ncbi:MULTISPECIES: DUF4158 domain-containing protein [unclassified Streptomyces]|uniref:DUF4158 domain-containing protein n=1 Tax=unclassified Streptomyces TaxID=2593676 RepID=UPI003866CE68
MRAHEEAQHAARARAEHTEKTLAAARGRWERFVPEDSWLTDDSARELAAPWSDPEITAARSELFLAALHLHQAFLRCTARTMYANLMAGMDAVAGAVPKTVPEAHASGQVRSDNHLLALMVQLKCFNRMGYFPRLDDVPEAVVAHIRRDLGLGEDVAAVYDSDRTRGHHRMLIRRRSEVVSDIQQDRRRRHHREVRRAQGLRPRHRRRPSRLTSCASVRQPVQLVRQGFGDGTDAAV